MIAVAAMAVAAASSTARVPSRTQPDPLAILRRSAEAKDRVPVVGHLSVMQWKGDRTVATLAHVSADARGRYRQEYDAPRSAHGKVVVYDGKELWQYDPSRHVIRVDPLPAADPQAPDRTVRLLSRNYVVRKVAEAVVAGRPAYVLRLKPRDAGKGTQMRWIDQKTLMTLRLEKRSADGVLAYAMRYFDVKLPATIGESAFRPPSVVGARIVRTQRGPVPLEAAPMSAEAAARRLPLEGPLGFQLQRALFERDGAFHAVYFDGLESISVFVRPGSPLPRKVPAGWQAVRMRDKTAYLSRGSHTDVMVWSSHGLRFTAVSRQAPRALRVFVAGIP